jgi:heptosyltransferase-2
MHTLILKLAATGDVVRTTSLLRRLEGTVTWLSTAANQVMLPGPEETPCSLRVVSWENRSGLVGQSFDLVINLEDDPEVAAILECVRVGRLFGGHLNKGKMAYTEDSRSWFDMSLISVHGREKADTSKFQNRRSYQELIFEGLGWTFAGEEYCLPLTKRSSLTGDVAIAPESGPVWPMKKWAHYERLKLELERQGLIVNFLPKRPTLTEHLADVRGHRCLVSGDSLPMHLALGSGVPCVALFNCTSPWEIYDYGILIKLISPLLNEFFYKRDFDARATTAIRFEDVLSATLKCLELARS